jgi:hypothetical protein
MTIHVRMNCLPCVMFTRPLPSTGSTKCEICGQIPHIRDFLRLQNDGRLTVADGL